MKNPIGQLKLAMAMLWGQLGVAGSVVIGSFFKDVEGREVGFCVSFLGVSAVALWNLMQVSAYLQQSPESDADKSDDS